MFPLLLASPIRLFDHRRHSFAGGLPFRLEASKTTRFLLRPVRNFRAYWLHSRGAHTSWGLPTQRAGALWLRNQCCAPAEWCGTPRIEKKETATIPKMKEYNSTPITRYIPRYIVGGGPIKQQRERGPHYHHNVQENVLYNNSLPTPRT